MVAPEAVKKNDDLYNQIRESDKFKARSDFCSAVVGKGIMGIFNIFSLAQCQEIHHAENKI